MVNDDGDALAVSSARAGDAPALQRGERGMSDAQSPSFAFADGAAQGTIDLRIYRLSAVKKAAYRVAERCTAVLGSPIGDELPVRLVFKSGATPASAKDVVRAFFEELLDQELREQVAEETGPLRTLILAHAFSKTDLIRRE